MEIAAHAHSPSSAVSSSSSRDENVLARLDGLLDLAPYELEALYHQAKTPQLDDVGGDLRGRMLAWPVLVPRPRIQAALRAFAGAATFPWKGKSFTPDPRKGAGINRVFSDRFRLFRFDTFIAKSRAGDFDALQLDYDLAGNPPIIRSIKDEIREIEPNLWLGQAYYQTTKSDWLWLYFALARLR